jgi:hypothetical protein
MDNNNPPPQGEEAMGKLENDLAELEKQTQPVEAPPATEAVAPPPAPTPVTSEETPAPTPPPVVAEPKKRSPILLVAVVLLVLSLVGGGAYFFASRMKGGQTTACTTEAKLCPDGSTVGRVGPNCEFAPCPSPSATPDPTASWQTYLSSKLGFSLKYPAEVKATEDAVNNSVYFSLLGPTQKEGTEFFDGISLSIKSGSLGGKTLKEFVDTVGVDDEVSQIVSGPEVTTIAGLSAYKLRIRGLGEFDYYYFQKGASGYLELVNNTLDPENQGFLQTASLMMESLKILEATPSASPLASPSASPGI